MLLVGIICVSVLIYTKANPKNGQILKNKLFSADFSFAKMNQIYNKYLGNVIPFKDTVKTTSEKPVFQETLKYKKETTYKDGVKLTVDKNYLIPVAESGMVVFIGEKEGYGNTVIIQQMNGVDLWYGDIGNANVKLYDYVEKGSLLGETKAETLYLVYQKEGKALNYKDYLK